MITSNYLLPMSKTHAKAAIATSPDTAPMNPVAKEGELNRHQALMVQDKGMHYIDQSSMVLTLRLDHHC